jgi:hypothetical protein
MATDPLLPETPLSRSAPPASALRASSTRFPVAPRLSLQHDFTFHIITTFRTLISAAWPAVRGRVTCIQYDLGCVQHETVML